MKRERKNKSFRIGAIAFFIFALCGVFSGIGAAQETISLDHNEKTAVFAPREVRVVTQSATPGQTITVVLAADAMGDESIYGFSLGYDTSILTYVPNSITIGSGATSQAGGMCNVSSNATTTTGRIGFSISCDNSTITAGNNRPLVTLQFTVAGNAPNGATALTFGDTPTARSVASNPAAGPIMNLPTTFTDGAVNIAAVAGSNRIVRVVSQNTTRGATVTVVLTADTMGDESIYGFSLGYSTSILTYVPNSITIGSGATRQAGGMCSVSSNTTTTAGKIGFSINCNDSTITAGNARPLVTLQFMVATTAPFGQTPLTFDDTPTIRRVASNPAAGTIMNLPTTFTDGFVNVAMATQANRVVRVLSQDTTPGATITVVLTADAMGDESIYGFSLNYATNALTYVPNSTTIGSGATSQAGGMCNVSSNATTAGRIGFSISCDNSTITAGNNRPLVTLQFMVASNAPSGSTPLTFGDVPTARSVASNPAAGPIMNLPTTFIDGVVNIAAAGSNRIVRVVSQNTTRGATVTVVLTADTMGDESIYGFSLRYDTSILTYVPNSITIGSGATRQAGGMCGVSSNTTMAGDFGFSINCNDSTITAGNARPLVTLQFVVSGTAPFGQTPLTFDDTPTIRRVASNPAAGPIMNLPTAFFNGFLNITTAPTAAGAQVSGRVFASGRPLRGAVIYLTGSNGATRTTQTNPFGYYRFDEVEIGGIYTITVRHKRFQFAPRVISFSAAVENLDFTAEPPISECEYCQL